MLEPALLPRFLANSVLVIPVGERVLVVFPVSERKGINKSAFYYFKWSVVIFQAG